MILGSFALNVTSMLIRDPGAIEVTGAAAWPHTGRAEPTDRMRRIGVLSGCHERSRPNYYDRVRHHARQLDTVSAVALAIGV
jgi:hypothetical protein